ncbi:MAG: CvpA family protein [Bacteroidia bacterium]|nr:CvpA family protein [Bacteroidia bacterium]
MSLSTIDILILIPLAWGLIRGAMKGFIIELASLLGFWLGIVVAWKFSFVVKDYLSAHYQINQTVLPFLSFILLFAIVAIGVMILGKFLHKLAELIQLEWLNRLLGGFFGLLKNTLMVGVFLFILNWGKLINQEKYMKHENSILYEPVYSLGMLAWPMLSQLSQQNLPDASQTPSPIH